MPFPALFVSHGAPSAALEDDAYTRSLGAWARGRPRPRAIVVVSAHGEAQGPPRVSSAAHPDLIYDFFVLGSRGPRDRAFGVYEGFRYGSLSLRSFALATQ